MAVDVETAYLFNGFQCVGKDESRSGDVRVPIEVVMNLVQEWPQRNLMTITSHPEIFVWE